MGLSCYRIIRAIVFACILVAAGACWHNVDFADPSKVDPLDRMQPIGEAGVVQGHIVDAYYIYRYSLRRLNEQGKRK